ncbi:MAG: hypothetical protein GFH27_549325n102 [Chloroflexi bacterium AL-W]|nr:hypothetical protein [Chloroflexi bacterium AL-N1]NOK70048.1 hypothetical protein [Chloroflexi bacterium AL-N10]NOK77940.1 hypothetical protein [Chloroflexi bacterium AL-N5]NOK84949.1 hypothetical protein [Chloroflexi bacterium AL-W]NOK91928.1 hypothetical protein [Chloroflexi bacterium AL-N15]
MYADTITDVVDFGYGHCNFASSEILVALGVLVLFVSIGEAANTDSASIQADNNSLDSILQEFSHKSGVSIEELRKAEKNFGVELPTQQ